MAETLVWGPHPNLATCVTSVTLSNYDWLSFDPGFAESDISHTTFGNIVNSSRGSWRPRVATASFDVIASTRALLIDEIRKLHRLTGCRYGRLTWTPDGSDAIIFDVLDSTIDAPLDSNYQLNVIRVTITWTIQPFGKLPEMTTFQKNVISCGNFERPDLGWGISSDNPFNFYSPWSLIETLSSNGTQTLYSNPNNSSEVTIANTSTVIRSDFIVTYTGETPTIQFTGRRSAGATGNLNIYVTGTHGAEINYYGPYTKDISTLGTSDATWTVSAAGWRPIKDYAYTIRIRASTISGTAYLRTGTTSSGNMGYSTDSESTWTRVAGTGLTMLITGLTYVNTGAGIADFHRDVHQGIGFGNIPCSGRFAGYIYSAGLASGGSLGWWQNVTVLPSTSYWMGFSRLCNTGYGYLRLRVVWKTAGGTTISTSTWGNFGAYNPTAWIAGGQAVTSPATAAQADVYIEVYNSTGGNISCSLYVAEIMLIENATAQPATFIESKTRMPCRLSLSPAGIPGDDTVGAYLKFARSGDTANNQIAGLHIAEAPVTNYTKNIWAYYAAAGACTYFPDAPNANYAPPDGYRNQLWHKAASIDCVSFPLVDTYQTTPNAEVIALGWSFGGRNVTSHDKAIPAVYGTFRVLVRTMLVRFQSTQYMSLRARVGKYLPSNPWTPATTGTVSAGPWTPVLLESGVPVNNEWRLVDLGTIYIPPNIGEMDTPVDSSHYWLYLDMRANFAPATYQQYWILDCLFLYPVENYLVIEDPNENLIQGSASSLEFVVDTREALRGALLTDGTSSQVDWEPYMRGTPVVIGNMPRFVLITQDWKASNECDDLLSLTQIKYSPPLRGYGSQL